MADCPFVEDVTPFATLAQELGIPPRSQDTVNTLTQVIESSLGGFIINTSQEVVTEDVDAFLEKELDNRFSFSWLISQPRPRKTLALLEGGRSKPENSGTIRSIYSASNALGIDLVVLDIAWSLDRRTKVCTLAQGFHSHEFGSHF